MVRELLICFKTKSIFLPFFQQKCEADQNFKLNQRDLTVLPAVANPHLIRLLAE